MIKLCQTIRMSVSALVLTAAVSVSSRASDAPGAVYVMSNSAQGNSILVFDRSAQGALIQAGSEPTGGLGTGGGLGNQGALVLTKNERFLYAVNAGSDSISAFEVQSRGLRLLATVPSGGRRPISLTIHSRLLYALNAGGSAGAMDRVAGFRLGSDGIPVPIDGATQILSAPSTSPAQVSFTSEGTHLVVTEKRTNLIDVIALGDDGRPVSLTSFPSSGATPFGFALGKRDQIFVSEAFGGMPGLSAVSSYEVGPDGTLVLLDPSVPTTETAACWVVVTNDGRFAFETNTGSDTVSGFAIEDDGSLRLLDDDGVTAQTGVGSGPIDMGLSNNSRFLFTLNGGTGTISGFRVKTDGGLVPIGTTPGLPAGANGLAAR